MKHLIQYRVFESNDLTYTTRENISDICLDLTDDGRFDISIYDGDQFIGWGKIPGSGRNHTPINNGDSVVFIGLKNFRDYGGFSFDEIKDVVVRITDYLGNRYKSCSGLSVGEIERYSIGIKKGIIDNPIPGNLTNLYIIYK